MDGLSEPEKIVVFALAKIFGGKEFLRANDLSPGAGRSSGGLQCGGQIGPGIRPARGLQEAEGDVFGGFIHKA